MEGVKEEITLYLVAVGAASAGNGYKRESHKLLQLPQLSRNNRINFN